MTWFQKLTGCAETSAAQVHEDLWLDGPWLRSRCNGQAWQCGTLETPSLAQLREQVATLEPGPGRMHVSQVVADVRQLHADPAHAHGLFQVASQFNLLEMVSPRVTPEQGIGIYENDHTQGPACAIAAGAGTIYRQYFVPLDGQIGQSSQRQIDVLAGLGDALGNADHSLWQMVNGYALPTADGLDRIDRHLAHLDEQGLDRLRQLLQIGIQWDTQVTLSGAAHRVTQVYCSALPVAYGRSPRAHWERFARLVLQAAYEATLCAALLNARRHSNPQVFLTLLGGGAFGNDPVWIIDAMRRALTRYADHGLQVAIVSHGRASALVQDLVDELAG